MGEAVSGAEPFSGSERFGVRRTLGRGGMGIVYEALDRRWNLAVALKTLHALSPEALLRLKNEFRALQGIHHPNLVRFGELLEDGGRWLFTMELVDGVDFVSWVRASGELNEARLRQGLAQLAEALHALHAAGKVHRDVKPSNTLVTRQGRVVLLDFGLLTRVASDDALTDGLLVGTVEYMAPEQGAGLPATPGADWYGLGTMLYEALTGQLPFSGDPMEILDDKQRRDPPRPSSLATVPPDLDRLCMAMLERDPDRRIAWPELARELSIATPAAGALDVPRTFVGRTAELGELDAAFDDARAGERVTVFVHGESGIGKSMLVEEFVRRLYRREEEVLVIEGHASDRELVPFNGFDGIVDALARHLRRLPRAEALALVPDDADALTAVFPAFARAPGFSRRDATPMATASPVGRRARAFAALGHLLDAVARRQPLVLVIDDFQWADEDTLALRAALMRGHDDGAAGRMLVAVVRTSAETRALVRRAVGERGGEVRHLFLEPLDGDDARALAGELLGGDREGAATVVREAHGHPLFLTQMALSRRAALGVEPDLHATVRARVAALSPNARRLMELLAVGGHPIRQSVAVAATGLDPESYFAAAEETRSVGLTRMVGAGLYAAIEPYHDQIRQALLEALTPERRRALHRALAEQIEGTGVEPRTLFLHWIGAGDDARAAQAATRAAEEADGQLAFERAAHFYGRAIELGAPAATLMPRFACALANAGHKRRAVVAYQRAARLADDESRVDHLRAAAEVLLRNGDIDEGIAVLRDVLRQVGMRWPRGDAQVRIALVAERARIALGGLGFVERPEAAVPRRQLQRVDTAWGAAMALVLVDRARGAYFQTRAVRLALAAGEPSRVACAVISEAGFSSMAGTQAWPRTEALLAEGRRLAERCGSPHALALIAAMEGIALALAGEFRAGAQRLQAAMEPLRRHATRWDLLNAEYLQLMVLQLVGNLAPLAERVAQLERDALASEDQYMLVNLRTGYPALGRLVRDDVARGRAALRESMGRWSQAGFHRQHWFAVFAESNFDLYEGKGEEAWRRLEASWRPLERSLLLRSQFIRIGAVFLRGRTALASGRRREARDAVTSLEREGAGWATALATLLRASLAPEAAAFARAAALLDGAELRMHAAVARHRAGQDDPWWGEQGVVRPEGVVRCFAPGG